MSNTYTKDVPITIKVPEGIEDKTLKEKIAVTLYKEGVISAYQARLIVDMTRRQFEEMLPKYGLTIAELDN